LLGVIEVLQILGIAFEETKSKLWGQSWMQTILSVLQYSQLKVVMDGPSAIFKTLLFYLVILLAFSVVVYYILFGVLRERRKGNTWMRNLERAVCWVLIAINSVGWIPGLQVLISYGGEGTVLGPIGALLFASEIVLGCYLLNDQDPFRKIPFGHSSPLLLITRSFSRGVLVLFQVLDTEGESRQYLVTLGAILFGVVFIWGTLFTDGGFNSRADKVRTLVDSVSFYFYLTLLLQMVGKILPRGVRQQKANGHHGTYSVASRASTIHLRSSVFAKVPRREVINSFPEVER
jgi:hypothetical protein